MQFDQILADIFDHGGERPKIEDAADERELIARAKGGDEEATIELLYVYAPAMRKALKWYMDLPAQLRTSSGAVTALEDARMGAVLGVIEAINTFDPELAPDGRLAMIVREYVLNHVSDNAEGSTLFTVPSRTLTRFYSIMRMAGGNVYEAAALAPRYEMRRETFFDVLSALRTTEGFEALTEEGFEFPETASPIHWSGEHADADDAVLVAAAFLAVDPVEEEVCRTFFAFDDPYRDANRSDAETAGLLGMTRPTVQRTRARALGKMRVAIAATEEV